MKLFLAGVTLAAMSAFAQDAPPPPPPPHAAPPPMTRAAVEAMVVRQFAKSDANHDGIVTRAEFDAYEAERRAQREARGDTPSPPPPPVAADGTMRPPPPPPGMGRMHGPGTMGMGPRWFDRADVDHDGRVTLAEAKAAALAMFDRMDANHDGTVGPDEMRPPRGPGGPAGAPPVRGPGYDLPAGAPPAPPQG